MFKFPNGIINSPKSFAEKYLETLAEVSKKIDLEKIKKISDLLSKYYYSKTMYLFVEMVVQQQFLIIFYVII